MATAALHNLAVLWNEGLPEEDSNEDEDEDDSEPHDEEDNCEFHDQIVIGDDQATRDRIRREGTEERARLLRNMPEASMAESRRIRQNL